MSHSSAKIVHLFQSNKFGRRTPHSVAPYTPLLADGQKAIQYTFATPLRAAYYHRRLEVALPPAAAPSGIGREIYAEDAARIPTITGP